MRILIFTQQLASFRSGVGTYAYGLITGLQALKHQITVVVPEKEEVKTLDLRMRTVTVPRFDPTPGGWFSLGIAFAKILQKEAANYDIAFFTDARETWYVRRSPIPVIGMVNDSYALDWYESTYPREIFADRGSRSLYYRSLRWLEKYAYSRLNALTVNSNYVALKLTNGYHIASDRIHVIYIGIANQRPDKPIPLSGFPSILFVGNNFQRKGLLTLLQAASLLKSRFPHICIHVAGKDKNHQKLVAQAHKIGIIEAVVFHGWQPNTKVRAMMAGADIFALPSFTEGFGLVYLEAMQVGTPVIATSKGGAKEVLVSDKEVIFIDPGDIDGLAAAVASIAADPEIAARLSKEGRDAVRRFSIDTMAKNTESVLLKAITSGI
ncbi:MAG: glycosyltransferase family 4 protein [Desulfobacterales bacterium]|nr:MAG: glycosyltransferase family 4 protein [Desulfobacterales bacterium]